MTTTKRIPFSQRLLCSLQWFTALTLVVLAISFWTTEHHPVLLRQASTGFASFWSSQHDYPLLVTSDVNTGAGSAGAATTIKTDGPAVDLAAPPMGFMSWERFMCEIDCQNHPHECINEELYTSMADAMVTGGYVKAGYNRVDIDDCWAKKVSKSTNQSTQKWLTQYRTNPTTLPEFRWNLTLLFFLPSRMAEMPKRSAWCPIPNAFPTV